MISLYEAFVNGTNTVSFLLILGLIFAVALGVALLAMVYLLGKEHARENREELKREIRIETIDEAKMLFQMKRFRKR